jgi:hypothetical protein
MENQIELNRFESLENCIGWILKKIKELDCYPEDYIEDKTVISAEPNKKIKEFQEATHHLIFRYEKRIQLIENHVVSLVEIVFNVYKEITELEES